MRSRAVAEIINQLAEFFEHIILTFGYAGIFTMTLAENIFTPIPSEPLMPLSGILAAKGELDLLLVCVAALAGATFGSLILYAVGWWLGEPAVRVLVRRWGIYFGVTESLLDRGIVLFNRYGGWVIFIGRFLPMMRPVTALVAGMTGLKLYVFLPATILSTGLVTVIYVGAGYILGENWRTLLGWIDNLEPFLLVSSAVALIAAGVFIVNRWLRQRQPLLRNPLSAED